jgi:rubrerythrin
MAEGIDRCMRMLSAALEKEEKSRDFYKDAIKQCANEVAQEMYRMLMADEGIHMKRIKTIYAGLQGGEGWTTEWKAHRGEVEDLHKLMIQRISTLGPKITAAMSDLDALQIGIQMEQGAVNFYMDSLTQATDPIEKEFVELMLREERGHYAALTDLRQYFENPESWFIEKEHQHFDGA